MMDEVKNLTKNLKELDDTINYEFKEAAEAHARQSKRIRVDGDINIVAMAALMITILVLVYQVATWTTSVNLKLDIMTGLMAQTAENTKDIKELRREEFQFYTPKDRRNDK